MMMNRGMRATFAADAAAFARRQTILQQLEALLRQRATIDGSQIWKCPECRRVVRSDQGRSPRRGEAVCTHAIGTWNFNPRCRSPRCTRTKSIFPSTIYYSTVQIKAASAGAAGNLLRAQFHGCTVNISWIREVR